MPQVATRCSDEGRRRRRLFSGTTDRERGATLLEGAIVTPVFFLMVLGLFDGSWALFGNHVIEGSAAAGVRAVSALANDTDADFQAIQTIKSNMSSLKTGSLQRIVIYRANGFGEAPTQSCRDGVAFAGSGTSRAGACNVYEGTTLNLAVSNFGCKTNGPDTPWCPVSRKTALQGPNSPPDYIGVWISARHAPLTGVVIGYERTITSHSVQRIEPRLR